MRCSWQSSIPASNNFSAPLWQHSCVTKQSSVACAEISRPCYRLPDQPINVTVDSSSLALIHSLTKYLNSLAPGWDLGQGYLCGGLHAYMCRPLRLWQTLPAIRASSRKITPWGAQAFYSKRPWSYASGPSQLNCMYELNLIMKRCGAWNQKPCVKELGGLLCLTFWGERQAMCALTWSIQAAVCRASAATPIAVCSADFSS